MRTYKSRGPRKYGRRYQRASPFYFNRGTQQWAPKRTNETFQQFGRTYRHATDDQRLARRAAGYRGFGDYERGPMGGRFMPFMRKLPWQKIGKVAFGAARGGLGAFRGLGDYDAAAVEAAEGAPVSTYGGAVDNQLISGGNPPISVNASNDLTGDITFSHTEFVANISATTTSFENRTFAINPGLAGTFPFLSQLAQNFTLYDLEGLIFEYRPTSGEFGTTSNSLGKVIMATNYDPSDPAFTTARVMENYDYAVSSKPSLTMRHGVETANKQQALNMSYIRAGETDRDKIFTDLGLFQLATEGLPNTGLIGELWVTYSCKLSRSRINTHGCAQALVSFSAITASTPFNQNVVLHDSIGVTFNPDDATITFPKKAKGKAYRLTYTIIYGGDGPGWTILQPVPTWTSNGVGAPIIPGINANAFGDKHQTTVNLAADPPTQTWIAEQGIWFNMLGSTPPNPGTDNPQVKLSVANVNPVDVLPNPGAITLAITELEDGFAAEVNGGPPSERDAGWLV